MNGDGKNCGANMPTTIGKAAGAGEGAVVGSAEGVGAGGGDGVGAGVASQPEIAMAAAIRTATGFRTRRLPCAPAIDQAVECPNKRRSRKTSPDTNGVVDSCDGRQRVRRCPTPAVPSLDA